MKEKVSIIITCKGRLEHLKQTLPYTLAQTYDNIEIIIVDYNCPDGAQKWIQENISDTRVKTICANVLSNEWSLSAARNLGYKHSSGDILFFLDADAKTEPGFIDECIGVLTDNSYICGWGAPDATGCMIVHKNAFEDVNGYNENLKSWGFEDIEIYQRLQNILSMEMKIFPAGIETIKHGDELRNMYHENKNPNETNEENYRISRELPHKGLV